MQKLVDSRIVFIVNNKTRLNSNNNYRIKMSGNLVYYNVEGNTTNVEQAR